MHARMCARQAKILNGGVHTYNFAVRVRQAMIFLDIYVHVNVRKKWLAVSVKCHEKH